jgi:hypothetical protein
MNASNTARRTAGCLVCSLLAFSLLVSCSAPAAIPATAEPAWIELFDGQTLQGWQVTQFGGEGEVRVHDAAMQLGMGSPLTGIHLTAPPPTGEYELEVIAARIDGTDFFCGLTFPVGTDHLTLILGGWGGSVCGLSNLDGSDAARNATRTLKGFQAGQDYTATVRVTASDIQVLLDGQPFLSHKLNQTTLSLRPEVMLCRPLGIASFDTIARIKSVRWRPLLAH